MGLQSDTTTKEVDKAMKEKNKIKPVNIEDMTIFSSYEVLEDGKRIFSAED